MSARNILLASTVIFALFVPMLLPYKPTATESSTDDPTTTEPSTDDPTTTEPWTDDPITTELSTDDPTATEPSTDDPTATEPSTDDPTVTAPSIDGYILRSVHVVFRHGDSVPTTPDYYHFPNYPNVPHDFNPHAHSELTNIGRMRAYKLGQYLRSRYSDFLGETYRREDVYARSTYVERSRASLMLVLAGLYPPGPKQRWHPSLDWQPISIESPPNENDHLMWGISCPAYLKERKRIEGMPQFEVSIQSLVDFFVQLEKYKKPNYELGDEQLTDLYRKLRLGVEANVSVSDLANAFKNASSKIARNAAILRYHTQNYNDRLRKLNGGPLLKKILDDMQATLDGKPKPKISLYGGQEFNVVGLLWSLDAWKPIVPNYGTAVIVELWQKNESHEIKVLYHDGLTGNTETRAIEDCNTKICPFESIQRLRYKNLPQDAYDCYTENNIPERMIQGPRSREPED